MTESGGRLRLDIALVEKGLVFSRSRAKDLIKRERVLVDGEIISRPGVLVSHDKLIELTEDTVQYVSRGGEKLARALEYFKFPVDGMVVLDVGASTGGFSEVLLEHGARRIFAVDVGTDQLHPRLRADKRIVSLEGLDARDLDRSMIKHDVDGIVADVSFVSLAQVLVRPFQFLNPGGWLIALVKPQFEVGRKSVGKGGVVRDSKFAEARGR